jgi:dTMP kinase
MQPCTQGILITIEGIEGVGKSTAVKWIARYLTDHHHDVFVTREPGGTKIAERIRELLLTPESDEVMRPETELLLMFAARIQHIHQVILPALSQHKCVVSDRFIDASFAYQGGGRNIDQAHIRLLDQWLVNTVRPQLTILLDAPAEIGMTRAKHRGPHDRIEQEDILFFERVRQAYLDRATAEPNRFRVIDATQPLQVVEAHIKKALDELFNPRAN